MRQWLPTAAVAAACFSAFFVSAQTVTRDRLVSGEAAHGWQTYCAVPLGRSSHAKAASEFWVTPIGRASTEIRSGGLVVGDDGQLRVWDAANKTQFIVFEEGFEPAPTIDCPDFQAYGWTIEYDGKNGRVSACANGNCRRISVMPKTLAFSIAAAKGSIFVGTSQGDTLLFKEGRWCRMARTGDTFACTGERIPVVTEPSNQFYSSTVYRGRTLIGEYPSGRIFEFDGKKVFPSELTPPEISERANPGFESQVLTEYCGNLFVGYWPYGELYRYDGEKWHDPIRLFSSPPSNAPFKEAAEKAGMISNFFGQRVSSLVPFAGSLYAITSNKGDWNRSIQPEIPREFQDEYGAVYRIDGAEC